MKKVTLVAVMCLSGFLVRDVAAQGFISPFVATTLSSPSPNGDKSKPGFGLALGKLGSIFGVEGEFAYYPEILDNAATGLSKNRAISFSGNFLIGPKIGPVKVYGTVGAGDLLLNVTSLASLATPSPDSISNSYFTINVGGGVIGFINPHFGIRADVRDFRATGFDFSDLSSSGLAFTHFDFWRASLGVVAAF